MEMCTHITCGRCRNRVSDSYSFYEVNKLDERRKFGSFCSICTRELVDELRGKLEWIRFDQEWRGYVHPQARAELEALGFIQAEHETQFIEIEGFQSTSVEEKAIQEALILEYTSGLISQEEYHQRQAGAR
ncbi:MAG: hypothetical protein JSV58_05820 [Candidatus Bathyarchaeota archaeon]|nr:MAG: hypothetical protein JSV58_05820 [Candidatus Bathyarchaeota archaeon]